jgi:hypothetical protein
MNWHYFIGCKVKAYFSTYKLYSINREGGAYIDDLKTGERLFATLKDCKPILKPLESMIGEEKDKLQMLLGCAHKIKTVFLHNLNKYNAPTTASFNIILARTIYGTELYVNSAEAILYLMEIGCYIGQCELSECIIEEV